jgi:hypothetical protein
MAKENLAAINVISWSVQLKIYLVHLKKFKNMRLIKKDVDRSDFHQILPVYNIMSLMLF